DDGSQTISARRGCGGGPGAVRAGAHAGRRRAGGRRAGGAEWRRRAVAARRAGLRRHGRAAGGGGRAGERRPHRGERRAARGAARGGGGPARGRTGAPPVEADVRVSGDRIAESGARLAARGAEEVDLRGLALAPGFIDIHAHTDLVLLVNPRADSKVRQGVTTEVAGQDGGSVGPVTAEAAERRRESYRQRYGVDLDFRDLGGFFRRLDTQGAAVNLASMVGAGTIRGTVVGMDDRPATPEELK